MNKRNELQAMIDIHKPDIIGITEVKPTNSRFAVEECELALSGFELFHNLSSDGRGLALYIKTEMRPSLCESSDINFKEFILAECKQEDGSKLRIGLVYRSPNSTAENTENLNTHEANH
jgi:exonuclease III